MKRAALSLIYVLIVSATAVCVVTKLACNDVAYIICEDTIQQIADVKKLSRKQVQLCYHRSHITPEDLMHIDEYYDLNPYTRKIQKSISKIGCFLTCIFQQEKEEKLLKRILADIQLFYGLGLRRLYNIGNRRANAFNCLHHIQTKFHDCENGAAYFKCMFTRDL